MMRPAIRLFAAIHFQRLNTVFPFAAWAWDAMPLQQAPLSWWREAGGELAAGPSPRNLMSVHEMSSFTVKTDRQGAKPVYPGKGTFRLKAEFIDLQLKADCLLFSLSEHIVR